MCLLLCACAGPRPSALDPGEPWIVAIKSCRLPESMPWYTRFAHHTWIDVKRGDEQNWIRVEALGAHSGVHTGAIPSSSAHADRRWGRDIRLHTTLDGARAQRIAAAIEPTALAHHEEYLHGYRPWPGPNSNTLIAELAREIPDLAFVFDPNALGKDFSGWVSAGLTASKTGVRIDTVPLGFALGLREGVEVHFLGVTFGVSIVPPRLNLPLLPALPWQRSPVRPSDPDLAEIDYEVQLGVGPRAPAWTKREVKEFARQGVIRFRATGSEHWLLFTYELLEPRNGLSAKLHGTLTTHGPGSPRGLGLYYSFGADQRAQILDRPCGELMADLLFVHEGEGRFSGTLWLRKKDTQRPPE